MGLFKFSLVLLITLASSPSFLAQNTQKDYVDAHNAARAQVGVGPMHWDEQVAAYARNYAAKIQMANTCNNLVHSGGRYGENLAAGTGDFTGLRAVNLWVGEKSKYNYQTNSCVGGVCGHYTQVVWRSSVRLGCARVRCNNGWWYVICSYDPRGNIGGQRPY
ncbi:unnamed protein product [Coffea canephora]|uniref:SCP domain-containing protein n=1 Tax=Coffea canephora TaxID=49390 RepID=A0A068TM85_COFCA|nr:unnamed protein product [Coffea canephora]